MDHFGNNIELAWSMALYDLRELLGDEVEVTTSLIVFPCKYADAKAAVDLMNENHSVFFWQIMTHKSVGSEECGIHRKVRA